MRRLLGALAVLAVGLMGAFPASVGARPNAAHAQWGMEGDNVACVQFAEAIVLAPGPNIDGIFGDQTYYATLDLQAFYGLAVDGVVGRRTGEWVWYWDDYWDLDDCYPLVPTTTETLPVTPARTGSYKS